MKITAAVIAGIVAVAAHFFVKDPELKFFTDGIAKFLSLLVVLSVA